MTANFLPAFLVAYSDSSFTNPHEVVRPDDPPECTGNFTHMGAKYWGFETARHCATSLLEGENGFQFNHHAYHWFHIALNNPAIVESITISTKWFTGNQVPEISIELIDGHNITEVVSRTVLAPDDEQLFEIMPMMAEACIVKCFHEGGIARVNLFGETKANDAPRLNLLEYASISHVSNEHYGSPADAVAGNRQMDYMFGWESARSGFGEEALFQFQSPSILHEIVVDTYLHRLNPPLSCHVFGLHEEDLSLIKAHMLLRPAWLVTFEDGYSVQPENFRDYMQRQQYLAEPVENTTSFKVRLTNDHDQIWHPLISFGRLRPDTWHRFQELEYDASLTHLLYMHYPNGGIHGLKVFGTETR